MNRQQAKPESLDMSQNPRESKKFLGLVLALSFILAVSSFRSLGLVNFSGVDGSFYWALNVLTHMDLNYGRDIASTFGPLGFMRCPMPFYDNMLLSNLVSASVSIILGLAAAETLYAVRSRTKALVFFFCCYGAFWSSQESSLDYRIMLSFLVCTGGAFLGAMGWRRIAMFMTAALLAALVLFVKFNIGVLCCATLFVAVTTAFLIKDRNILVPALWSLFVFAAAVVSLSICFFGSVSGLLPYMKRSLEVASPYSQSMSTVAAGDLQLGAAVAFIAGAFALGLYSLLSKSRLAVALALTGIPLFLSFKHAFIRIGYFFNFSFVALVMLAITVLFAKRKQDYLALAALGVVLLPFLPARLEKFNWQSAWAEQPIAKGLSGVADLCDLSGFESRLLRITKSNYAAEKLPDSWLVRLKEAKTGVDCIPFNLFICPANNLKWCPAPVTQLFIAYHPALDLWTAEHFASAAKPDFLIAEFPDVDWRHPFFTCPLSWRAIFKNYQTVELSSKEQLLLQKREHPLTETLKPISKQPFGAGEWIPVPLAPEYVLAKISMKLNRLGSLREIIYRTDPVFMNLAYADGSFGYFRMLPMQANSGVLLSCLPRTIAGFKDMFSLKPKQRVTHFQIQGPGLSSFQKRLEVEFDEASYQCQ